MIGSLVSAKTLAAVGVSALVLGMAIGSGISRWHYAPRLDAALLRAKNLGEKVEEQSREVQALKDQAEKREQDAKAAIEAAQAMAMTAEAEAQRLLSLDAPSGVDECAAASALIRKELGK